MSKKTILAAGTSPFAHLLGGAAALAGRALGRRAEDEDEMPDAEDDGDEPDAAEPDDEPEKGKRGKKAKGEDGDDEDVDAEDDDSDVDAEEPEDDKEAKSFRAGRAAERKRCAAIFASPAAAGRPDLAATLAFGTNQTSAEAIAVLGAANTPLGRSRTLDDRMANRRDPKPGAGGGSPGKGTFASRMSAALTKAGR